MSKRICSGKVSNKKMEIVLPGYSFQCTVEESDNEKYIFTSLDNTQNSCLIQIDIRTG